MKVTSQGNVFSIHTDLLQTHNEIPPQFYSVRCSSERGYYLLLRAPLGMNGEKIYGVQHEKCEKVLNSFKNFERNLGVILSGDKGIGKSLFAKLLSVKAIEKGYPVLVVDQCYDGLRDFLESIDQECIVLFDEFDKTFDCEEQNELLPMLDGMSAGKKLFVVTCNSISRLNEFMVNRPGRFHYHLRFEYPDAAEVREYLEDKIPEQYYGEIQDVVIFSRKVKLNYDCLRAIAFELSMGIPFGEAIKDLNILNLSDKYYNVCLLYKNGTMLTASEIEMDLFDKGFRISIDLTDASERFVVSVGFLIEDIIWDESVQALTVPIEKLTFGYDESTSRRGIRSRIWDDDDEEERAKKKDICDRYKGLVPWKFVISYAYSSNPHYSA